MEIQSYMVGPETLSPSILVFFGVCYLSVVVLSSVGGWKLEIGSRLQFRCSETLQLRVLFVEFVFHFGAGCLSIILGRHLGRYGRPDDAVLTTCRANGVMIQRRMRCCCA